MRKSDGHAPKKRGKSGKTHRGLAELVENGDVVGLSACLLAGADPNSRMPWGHYNNPVPIIAVAAERGYIDCVRELIRAGADVNAATDPADESEKGMTALHSIILGGVEDAIEPIIRLLVDAGASTDAEFGRRHTALELAAKRKNPSILNLLLKLGARAHLQLDKKYAIIHWAAENGHLENVKRFLDDGVPVDFRTPSGDTPLMAACGWLRADVVKLLLQRGAQVDLKDDDDETALHKACDRAKRWGFEDRYQSALAVVEMLLKRGADVSLKCGRGWTPLDYLKDEKNGVVGDLLRKYGSS